MLYIVATPIGNLDDLSVRQAKTLANSDVILAEDTRSAQTLLNACRLHLQLPITNFQIPKVISYYKEKEFEKLPFIIEMLKQGKKVSLISESGMPLLSDPGYLLVKTAIKEGIPFTVIPGPSAVTTALAYSGFNPSTKDGGFMFLSFFPKKKTEMYRCIDTLKQIKKIFPEMIFVFFESPNRIHDTLQLIIVSKWNPDITICRELTKKFEEVIRGEASELLKKNYRGELTLLIK